MRKHHESTLCSRGPLGLSLGLAFLLTQVWLPAAIKAQDAPPKTPKIENSVQDPSKSQARAIGTWEAEVAMGRAGTKRKVTVTIAKRADSDGLQATVQVKGFPAAFVGPLTRDGNKLSGDLTADFGGRSIKAPFTATLAKGKLAGSVKLFRQTMAFTATRTGAAPSAKTPAKTAAGPKDKKQDPQKVGPAKKPAKKPAAKTAKASGPQEGESLLVKPRKQAPKDIAPFKIDYGDRKSEKDCKVAQWGPKDFDSPDYAYYAKKIFPITSAPISDGVVLVHRGKITAIGKRGEVKIPGGYKVIDGGDGWLFPGFLDLHSHIASGSFDLNDTVFATNPEFRTIDLIELHHPHITKALQGGVTSALYIPGSGSNMGGFGTLTKLAGKTVAEALIRFPGSLKIAQAGNPERRTGDMGAGRIGMNFGLRQALLRGKAYYQLWEDYDAGKSDEKPKKDPALEYLRGLFRHEYPVSVHTQAYQVCLETIRELHDELGLWVFIDHGSFDAFKLSEIALTHGVPVANGPRMYQMDRDTGEMWGTAGLWARGGKHKFNDMQKGLGRDGIAINTDAPVVSQEELPLQATCAVRLGLPWEWAIRGLTINPARFAGIEQRVGSLEVGKDADMVLWTGDPLDPRRYVRKTMVSGTIYYDCDPGGKDHGKRRF